MADNWTTRRRERPTRFVAESAEGRWRDDAPPVNAWDVDLNRSEIVDEGPLQDPGGTWKGQPRIRVCFRNIEKHLVLAINDERAGLVVGCVAWLTSIPVLRALARKHVSLIVQKEDFLRPEGTRDPSMIRAHYDVLRCGVSRFVIDGIGGLNRNSGEDHIPAVQMCGLAPVRGTPGTPRMHHKFLVFCRTRRLDEYNHEPPVPYAVWTGSYNPTATGARSLENAVYIEHPGIAAAYMREWAQVFALSQPLDWTIRYVAPSWRVGT